MSLTVPKLDDRSYAELVEEALAMIPRYAPEWTNHNASDPGITLVELFAFVSEILLYRLDRVSDANRTKFLKLWTGADLADGRVGVLDTRMREAVIGLRTPFRAVSCEDFERLSIEATRRDGSDGLIARAKCFPRQDLAAPIGRVRDRPGHVSLVFVPVDPWASDATVGGIGRRVEEFLEPRRLLTTKVHVVGPRYIDVSIRSRGRISHAHPREALRRGIEGRLRRFLDPLNGGAEGTGWPFGRAISTAEVYRQLHGIDGIEEITTVEFEVPDPSRLRRNAFGDAEVLLRPEELPRVGQVRFVS